LQLRAARRLLEEEEAVAEAMRPQWMEDEDEVVVDKVLQSIPRTAEDSSTMVVLTSPRTYPSATL
jgi:hypothetical protein